MKRIFQLFGIIWIFLFLLTLVTAPDIGFFLRLWCCFVMAIIAWIGIIFKIGIPTTKNESPKTPRKNTQQKIIYIFPGTERKFLYRFDGKYVYQGISEKFVYRVENNKIYKGLESKFTYRIDGNKIYRGFERQPLYLIDGKYIYSGDFSRQPIFHISNSKFI